MPAILKTLNHHERAFLPTIFLYCLIYCPSHHSGRQHSNHIPPSTLPWLRIWRWMAASVSFSSLSAYNMYVTRRILLVMSLAMVTAPSRLGSGLEQKTKR